MGERITINKEFTWAEDIWKLLYIEENSETFVLHLCKGVAVEDIQKAYEKEQKFGIPYMLPEDSLSEEQRLIREYLHPLIDIFDAALVSGGGNEGTIPSLMFYGGAKNEHMTLSFRRDDPAEPIIWRMFFSEKNKEDITVSLQ